MNDMVDDLLPRSASFDLLPLVHVFEQLRGGSLGDSVVEVGADVGSAVRTVLLAQVPEDGRSALLGCELDLGLGLFLGRRHVGWRRGEANSCGREESNVKEKPGTHVYCLFMAC